MIITNQKFAQFAHNKGVTLQTNHQEVVREEDKDVLRNSFVLFNGQMYYVKFTTSYTEMGQGRFFEILHPVSIETVVIEGGV